MTDSVNRTSSPNVFMSAFKAVGNFFGHIVNCVAEKFHIHIGRNPVSDSLPQEMLFADLDEREVSMNSEPPAGAVVTDQQKNDAPSENSSNFNEGIQGESWDNSSATNNDELITNKSATDSIEATGDTPEKTKIDKYLHNLTKKYMLGKNDPILKKASCAFEKIASAKGNLFFDKAKKYISMRRRLQLSNIMRNVLMGF